ncbi:MAG: hypothetical protein RIC56_09060 [Pseudomonadales bacterium]
MIGQIGTIRRLGCGLLLGLLLGSAAASAAEPQRRTITVWSQGTPLAGDLWLPAGLEPGQRVPGLLLVHGWGGVRAHLNRAYAPQFAALGLAVLTFDYRSWGDSPGPIVRSDEPVAAGQPLEPRGDGYQEARRLVDPLLFLEDIRNAFAWLLGEPTVDGTRLGIWGSSLGGGLALQTAIDFPEIDVLIAQIGNVNPRGGVAFLADDSPLSRRSALARRSARARGEIPPFPGPESGLPGLNGNMNWAAFWLFDPFGRADELTAATLIIDAADEELFDIRGQGEALYHRIRHRLPSRYVTLPGKHYDLYRGPSYERALEIEQGWLRVHLLGEGAP